MLETLRAKPHHIKQSIAFVITIVIFSGILFVWVSSRDARSREIEVRSKTVSPIDGVTSMFTGLVSGFKEKIAGTSMGESNDATVSATSSAFDLSGVVIIDQTATSGDAISTSTIKGK